MPADMNGADIHSTSEGPDSGPSLPTVVPGDERANIVLRVLVSFEHILLYIVAFALLVVGAAAFAASVTSALLHHASWTERLITSVEGILLFLIIMEIFITILTHVQGGRIQLEFFIVIGVIALVRHILSIVFRLTLPTSPVATQQQLWDLMVDAGAAFVLVAALAVTRWSAGRPDGA